MIKKMIAALTLVASAASAQVATYNATGQIDGIDWPTYKVRFYDGSFIDLYNAGVIPADQIMSIGSNNQIHAAYISAFQHQLADIVRVYGSAYIVGCGDACVISSPVGYSHGYLMEKSIRHGPLRTVVTDTGTYLDVSTVGIDHTNAIWTAK